jgi:class 3 adenylate cyclase
MHRWLLTWGDLHRKAVSGLKGRVRQFIADMALVTFNDGDDAVHGLLNLRALSALHNKTYPDIPPIRFKAALATGDLVLSPTGIVGRLVNHTFDLLNATPRCTISLDEAVYRQLAAYRDRCRLITVTSPHGDPLDLYELIDPAPGAE